MSEQKQQTLVEKLEKARDNHNYYLETCRNDRDKAYHSFGKKCYQKAIDIAKQHKCTWQGTLSKPEETIYYTLSCGSKYVDDCLGADVECFKYCPFCGGEIEFIETQEKLYQQEMDKIKFCGCGCILSEGSTRCSDCEALYDM